MAGKKGRSGGRNRKTGPRWPSGSLIRYVPVVYVPCPSCDGVKSATARQCRRCADRAKIKRSRVCACGKPKALASSQCLNSAREHIRAQRMTTCAFCGVRWCRAPGSHSTQKYCSRYCKSRNEAVARQTPEYAAALAGRRAEARIQRLANAKLKRAAQATQKRLARTACQAAEQRERQALIIHKELTPVDCLECGLTFIPAHEGHRYCSRACSRRMDHRLAKYRKRAGIWIQPDSELYQARRILGRAYEALWRRR